MKKKKEDETEQEVTAEVPFPDAKYKRPFLSVFGTGISGFRGSKFNNSCLGTK